MAESKPHNYLITITGPTAIGKTAMAIALAKHYNCNILSADSRQFYREMEIGTAVPEDAELNAAKHYFIQHKSITEAYTVGDFEREAISLLDDIYKNNNIAILVGGSGLYIDAVLKGFDDFPDINENVREEITAQYKTHGISYLQKELLNRDPIHYERVAKDNPQRLMRALEVTIGTGKPYSSFLNNKKNIRNFIPIIIGLEADREVLYGRINKRVDMMIINGLLKEVKSLLPFKNLNALQTVGYKELFDYFEGNNTLDEAIELIKRNTRRFSKRQMTWFRKTDNTKWFDYTTSPEIIINYINNTL